MRFFFNETGINALSSLLIVYRHVQFLQDQHHKESKSIATLVAELRDRFQELNALGHRADVGEIVSAEGSHIKMTIHAQPAGYQYDLEYFPFHHGDLYCGYTDPVTNTRHRTEFDPKKELKFVIDHPAEFANKITDDPLDYDNPELPSLKEKELEGFEVGMVEGLGVAREIAGWMLGREQNDAHRQIDIQEMRLRKEVLGQDQCLSCSCETEQERATSCLPKEKPTEENPDTATADED